MNFGRLLVGKVSDNATIVGMTTQVTYLIVSSRSSNGFSCELKLHLGPVHTFPMSFLLWMCGKCLLAEYQRAPFCNKPGQARLK